MGIDRLIEPALHGASVAWCGPSYRSVLDAWEQLRVVLQPAIRERNEQEHRMRLATAGRIEMWSLDDPDQARGRAYQRIVVDEAASCRYLQYAWEHVLRPTLTDTRGDAWFLSTPKGLNYFHRLYLRGGDLQEADWAAWRFPTSDNPVIEAEEIESAQRDLPERVFEQEYNAEFLETEGQVFRRVLEAVREPIADHDRHDGRPQYVIGVDWARLRDFTVYCVLDISARKVVALDRFREIDYSVQLARLRALAKQYPPLRIIAERNAMGDPLIETLRKTGLPVWPYLTTSASKHAAIEALALAFEQGDICIPDDRVLIGELLAYQAERLPSGLLRYEAPPGGHDDTVMALALAWQGVARQAHSAAEVRRLYGW